MWLRRQILGRLSTEVLRLLGPWWHAIPLAVRGPCPEVARIRETIGGGGSVVLVGAAGVGKSRLAARAVTEFAGSHAVLTVHATRAARELPFGAVAPLLPDGSPGANPLGWAGRALLATACDRPLQLAVDDAHLLDAASAALVHQLAARAQVMATVRAGEECPEPVTQLWKDDLARRFDLGPFLEEELGEVLAAALGGPVSDAARARFHHLSQGNALYLRELVLSGWDWRGGLTLPDRLAELIAARIGELPGPQAEVLELTACVRTAMPRRGSSGGPESGEQRRDTVHDDPLSGLGRVDEPVGQRAAQIVRELDADQAVNGGPQQIGVPQRIAGLERRDLLDHQRERDRHHFGPEPGRGIEPGHRPLEHQRVQRRVLPREVQVGEGQQANPRLGPGAGRAGAFGGDQGVAQPLEPVAVNGFQQPGSPAEVRVDPHGRGPGRLRDPPYGELRRPLIAQQRHRRLDVAVDF
jgi:hypothetical protein